MCGGRGGRRCGALRGPTPLTQRSRGCFSDQALKGLCSKVPSRTNGSRCSSRALRCSYFLLISEFVERCLVDSLSGGFKGKKDISYLLREFRREKILKIKKSKTVGRSEAYEREIESERRLKKSKERERERETDGVWAVVLSSRAAPSNAYFVCLSSDSPQNLLSSLPCGLAAVSHPLRIILSRREAAASLAFFPFLLTSPAFLRSEKSVSLCASLIVGTSECVRACALDRARVRVLPSLAVYGGCGSGGGEDTSNSRYPTEPG